MNYNLPIPNDSKIFEWLITDLLNALYKTTSFNLYGRKGQRQHGIDIISHEKNIVSQCKIRFFNIYNKNQKRTFVKEILKDVDSILKYAPKTKRIIIATNVSNDTLIQDQLNTLMISFGMIEIEYWDWEYVSNNIFLFNEIVEKYFGFRKGGIEIASIRVLDDSVYSKSLENERLYIFFQNIPDKNQLPVFDISLINNNENGVLLNSIIIKASFQV